MVRIAVMMDENTSKGGTHYEFSKNYIDAIANAGGLPFGIPYVKNIISDVVNEFDGFFSVGGFIESPSHWYIAGQKTIYPKSEGRVEVEPAIMQKFLEAKKPVLGACSGMQTLAALNGCKLKTEVEGHSEVNHDVRIVDGTLLSQIVRVPSLNVNSRHREAVAVVSPQVRVGAFAPDGTIEAIELPGHPFALGYQWHQEDFCREDHPGNRIFAAFVQSARDRKHNQLGCG